MDKQGEDAGPRRGYFGNKFYEEGWREGFGSVLRDPLEFRFGAPPAWVEEVLETSDSNHLEQILRQKITAKPLEAARA